MTVGDAVARGSVEAGPDDTVGLALARGSHDALAEAYRLWGSLVHGIALRSSGDRSVADDVTQQVFVRAWQGRDRYDPTRRPLPAWLVGITRHVLADHFRGLARQRRVAERAGREPAPVPVASPEDVLDSIVLSEALAHLDRPRRDVVLLTQVEGLTHAEVAARLHLPLGTVKSHARRGLLQLRSMVGGDDGAS